MLCRVGITTDPERRRKEWEKEVVGLSGWEILATFPTKEKAQAYEDQYAANSGCKGHAGGPDTPGTWSVYRFDYTG